MEKEESRPLIDARELIPRYRDFLWAETFRLERLSLCQMGVTRQGEGLDLDVQLGEVFGVPLP